MASSVSVPANPVNQRRHGTVGRPPIREYEAIEALNPLVNKDKKTMEEMRQESEKLYNLVIHYNQN